MSEGWWDRLVHSRASAEAAKAVYPYLLDRKLAPWTLDFLRLIWSNCLDQVVLSAIELLKDRREDVHNFRVLAKELRARSVPAARQEWDAYLKRVLKAARSTDTFRKARLNRDLLVAHENLDPMMHVKGFADIRVTMEELVALQDLAEAVFACFPEGDSFGMVPHVARYYPELVHRIVAADLELQGTGQARTQG